MLSHKDCVFTKTAQIMGMLIAVVLVLLFLQPMMAGIGKAQTQYTTLKGYVIDTSNIGVSCAQISVSGMDIEYTNSTQTENDGYYEFSVLGGYVSVRVSVDGYQEYINILNVYDAELWNNVTLQTSTGATITGYVFDSMGTFLNNVTIMARDAYSSNGNSTTTDFDGFYEIKTDYSLVILTSARESYNLYATLLDLSQDNVSWLNITMDQRPIARASGAAYANIGENVYFDANASTDDVGIDAYYWEFGDGVDDTGKNVIHKYSANGVYKVNLTVVDTAGGIGSDTLILTVGNITPINHAPVVASIPLQSVTVGTQFTYQITATDEDNDSLIYSIDSTVLTINSTGYINGTPMIVGAYKINITVSDTKTETTVLLNLNVSSMNHAPTIASIESQTATINTEFTYQVTAVDQDNDVLTYKASIGTITSTGLFKCTPTTIGDFNVTITVDDGKGGMANTTFTLTVKEKPAPPAKGFLPGFEIITLLCASAMLVAYRRKIRID